MSPRFDERGIAIPAQLVSCDYTCWITLRVDLAFPIGEDEHHRDVIDVLWNPDGRIFSAKVLEVLSAALTDTVEWLPGESSNAFAALIFRWSLTHAGNLASLTAQSPWHH